MTDSKNINKILEFYDDNLHIKEIIWNYDIIELGCLKELISKYVKAPYTIYRSKNNKNKYFSYIKTRITKNEKFILDGINQELKELIIKYVGLIIEIDIKYLKKIRLKILITKNVVREDKEKLNDLINFFSKKVENDINLIIEAIKNKTTEKSGLSKFEGITKKEIVGYFNSKYIEIDAGKTKENFINNGKKIKVKYKFNVYYVYTSFDKTTHRIEFWKLFSNVLSELFQTIAYVPFISLSNQNFIGENDDLSFFNKQNNFIIISDENEKIPTNIDKYIDNFFKFDTLKQNFIFRSCKSLNNAMKIDGIKSIFYTYQALENIAAFYEKINTFPSNTRSDNIKKILTNNFSESFSNKVHKDWDDYRNKFAHNGIEENELIEIVLDYDFDSFKIVKPSHVYIKIVRIILINILKDNTNSNL